MDEDEQAPPAWFTAHEQSLTVGTRVRVKLTSECPWFSDQDFTDHTNEVDGSVGVISMVASEGTFTDRHRYFLHFDRPYPLQVFYGIRKPGYGGNYTAAELEPLADPDDRSAD